MQVYQRIANPYMPQGKATLTNAPNTSTQPFYAPGEIGGAFYDPNTGYAHARVVLDSGATSANPVGAVAVGQLAFWKDRTNNIVTNDKRFAALGASGAINGVAGVFALAVTAGYVCDIIIQGRSVSVLSDGSPLIGAQATADTTANVSRITYTSGVNTAPVSQVVGVMTSSSATNNLVPVDVNLGSFMA